MSTASKKQLGFLRTCIDRRFIEASRQALEEATGLEPTDYWHEAYAGGSAVPPASSVGEDYTASCGATIFGWQAHGDGCGGQEGLDNSEIARRLDSVIQKKKNQYPTARHFRIFATDAGVEITEVS